MKFAQEVLGRSPKTAKDYTESMERFLPRFMEEYMNIYVYSIYDVHDLEFLQNNTFFKATFPGVVSAKNFEDGELFNGARAILTVTQINVLKTLISIPEAYFPRVKQGMKLELISDIYPDKKFPAVIETIYPTIDAATHTFQCKVRIPNGTNLSNVVYVRDPITFFVK